LLRNGFLSTHGDGDMWSGSLIVDALAIASLALFAMLSVLPFIVRYDHQPKP
jgi:hypothetical protein